MKNKNNKYIKYSKYSKYSIDSTFLIDWLILSCETDHSAMGWTLIIALFNAQSIRMLSRETANENNCGEKAQKRSRDFIFIGIKITGHI
jgi:hypothetical protein